MYIYIYIYVYLVFMGNNPQESLNPCGVLGRLSFCNQRGRLWRPCHGTTGDLRGAAWRGEPTGSHVTGVSTHMDAIHSKRNVGI